MSKEEKRNTAYKQNTKDKITQLLQFRQLQNFNTCDHVKYFAAKKINISILRTIIIVTVKYYAYICMQYNQNQTIMCTLVQCSK
jgi:hypothetical protein